MEKSEDFLLFYLVSLMETQLLNKYERARLVGARALQLAFGAPPLLEVEGKMSPMQISLKELEAGIIPLVVIR
jgi:DNA-directed RNA polymerase subunit K/omega